MAPRKKKAAVATDATAARQYAISTLGDPGFFQVVESNIKGGVKTQIGACTAIVSPRNRAGKTAVLDSFRYALTGTHPIGPHYADLCGLTADGSAPYAILSGAPHDARTMVPIGKKSPAHEDTLGLSDADRASLLPLSALRDLLTLGTAKAREELFRRFGGDATDAMIAEEAPDALDDEQVSVWQEALKAAPESAPVADRLAAAGEWIRKEKRRLSATVKSLEEERARLIEETKDAGVVTDADIKRVEAQIAQHKARKDAADIVARKEQHAAELNDAIEAFQNLSKPVPKEEFDARPEVAARQVLVQQAEDKLKAAEVEYANKSRKLKNAQQILVLRKHLAGGCLVCGGAEPTPEKQAELVQYMDSAVHTLAQLIEFERRAVSDAQHNLDIIQKEQRRLNSEEQALYDRSVRMYEDHAKRVKMLADNYKHLCELAEAKGVAGDAPAESEAYYREQLAVMTATKVKRERVSALKMEVRSAERAQDDAKAVEKALADESQRLLEGIKARAEEAVNEWMPDRFRAVLQLEDDGKPECRWEVIGSDHRPHKRGAASGAEWSALTIAIACAWAQGPLRFLLLDDGDIAGFSAENVRHILTTIQRAVEAGRLTQALVAWSRPEEIPDTGWTVVEL